MIMKTLTLTLCLVATLTFGSTSVSAQTEAPAEARDEPLPIVASFSILADMARQIGGDDVSVTSLIGPDEDAHGYQPRPSDARLLGQATLVIANGLGFDTWIERLAASAGQTRIVVASEGVTTLESAAGHDDHDHHGHDHGAIDPHAWQNVGHARIYARNIAAALQIADPDRAEAYRQRADDYDRALAELDAEIRSTLAQLPATRRKLVTSHDAFAYFGQAYDISVIAAAGISYESEPSAAGIARLIRQLRRENVPVIFVENISDPRLVERIARESGAQLGGKLYSDALSGPDGSAPTYVEMMRANLEQLITGLTQTD